MLSTLSYRRLPPNPYSRLRSLSNRLLIPPYPPYLPAISRPSTYVLLWYPYIYFACNVFYFLRIHVNLLASTLVSFDCFARSGLFAIRERGHSLSCGLSNSVGLVTLVLKRSSPRLQAAYPVGLKSTPIPHHPDQMTLQLLTNTTRPTPPTPRTTRPTPSTTRATPLTTSPPTRDPTDAADDARTT
ncbi:hypothetical protein EV715DRAFT_297911 [Schizophyllum commune]